MAVDYDFPQDESVLSLVRNDPGTYQKLEKILCDPDVHMTHRIRALFTLKAFKTELAVETIGKAFSDSSVLLKHELAYVLGQMQLPCAIPILSDRLNDLNEDPMVRHEAAEALGAIGDPKVLPLLQKFKNPSLESPEVVRQTCELAVDFLEYQSKFGKKPSSKNNYAPVDPAPPFENPIHSISELHTILMDTNLPLFKRYQAMFSLRNIGTSKAVIALADGFKDASALFRHEIAYVYGQLQSPESVPFLYQVLENASELSMVRHEAAEALGSVATEECIEMLKRFAHDKDRVVRESCQVGIDIWEYERSGELQYANAL